ncbi:MAG: pyrroline-5-carboxylate reductase [Candidatus Omnitrophica bacterium]|nr:pyrroline-5-carboxylate reductase [Candidatus Omnitrophota bacterium]MBU4478107.1 pyrroline-5-carboxylate reductase [Candidatus Omnitrophota bacterium]MCG2702930.1 pyrroline-5-carboxylate reductase [Candidatus Omnitrophota bacterium]
MKTISIGIIGAGNMGEAIIKGLCRKKGFRLGVYEQNKARMNLIARRYAVKRIGLDRLTKSVNIIIICVKPQDIDNLLVALRVNLHERQVIISIAAGITTAFIERRIGIRIPVARVMPNMPGLIGKGVSVYCLGRYAGKPVSRSVMAIFSVMGETLQQPEKNMDAVTAVSGSGPGFAAYLFESMIGAAKKAGIDAKTAQFLCLKTLEGTLAFLNATGVSPEELVRKVASKGGTTEAGLDVFKNKNIAAIVGQAIQAAVKRAKELRK